MEKISFRYTTAFSLLASVEVLHEYYSSGRCADLIFQPSQETIMLLRQYSILLKTNTSGFTLLLDENRDLSSPVFGGVLRLQFNFRNRNPLFLNFTDIPYNNDQYYVFSSNSNNGTVLHPNEQVQESSLKDYPSDGFSGHVELFFNTSNELFGYGDSERQGHVLSEYVIRFGARKTAWKYFFYGENSLVDLYSDFSIKSKGRDEMGMFFGAPEKVTLKNGSPAFTITSDGSSPLLDKPKELFTLNKAASNTGQIYLKSLPNANPKYLNYNEKLNIFYTEIFVKL